jgi:hypothetical protein
MQGSALVESGLETQLDHNQNDRKNDSGNGGKKARPLVKQLTPCEGQNHV